MFSVVVIISLSYLFSQYILGFQPADKRSTPVLQGAERSSNALFLNISILTAVCCYSMYIYC